MDLIERQVAIDAIISYNGVVDKSVAKRILIQLPPSQLKPHYCRECKWSQYRLTGKYVNTETYWYCFNWGYDTDEEGYCHKFERRTDEYTN